MKLAFISVNRNAEYQPWLVDSYIRAQNIGLEFIGFQIIYCIIIITPLTLVRIHTIPFNYSSL